MRDVYLFFSGQASACRVRGGGRGEEHHVHERQPQEMDSEEHQLVCQAEGERERSHHDAEMNQCATNDEDGRSS